jgi:hypothetical protein
MTLSDRTREKSRELHPSLSVRLEQWGKARAKLRMAFEKVDDGREVQQQQGLIGQIVDC